MKKSLKNLLMKHLIDIVTSRGFRKKIPFAKFINTFLYLNALKHISSGKFRQKSINEC